MKKVMSDMGELDIIETPEEYFKLNSYDKAWFLINKFGELEKVQPVMTDFDGSLSDLLEKEKEDVKVPNNIIGEILENTGIKTDIKNKIDLVSLKKDFLEVFRIKNIDTCSECKSSINWDSTGSGECIFLTKQFRETLKQRGIEIGDISTIDSKIWIYLDESCDFFNKKED